MFNIILFLCLLLNFTFGAVPGVREDDDFQDVSYSGSKGFNNFPFSPEALHRFIKSVVLVPLSENNPGSRETMKENEDAKDLLKILFDELFGRQLISDVYDYDGGEIHVTSRQKPLNGRLSKEKYVDLIFPSRRIIRTRIFNIGNAEHHFSTSTESSDVVTDKSSEISLPISTQSSGVYSGINSVPFMPISTESSAAISDMISEISLPISTESSGVYSDTKSVSFMPISTESSDAVSDMISEISSPISTESSDVYSDTKSVSFMPISSESPDAVSDSNSLEISLPISTESSADVSNKKSISSMPISTESPEVISHKNIVYLLPISTKTSSRTKRAPIDMPQGRAAGLIGASLAQLGTMFNQGLAIPEAIAVTLLGAQPSQGLMGITSEEGEDADADARKKRSLSDEMYKRDTLRQNSNTRQKRQTRRKRSMFSGSGGGHNGNGILGFITGLLPFPVPGLS